jgi:hypothetical protein
MAEARLSSPQDIKLQFFPKDVYDAYPAWFRKKFFKCFVNLAKPDSNARRPAPMVTVALSNDKVDATGTKVPRTLYCTCSDPANPDPLPICPVHLFLSLFFMHVGSFSDSFRIKSKALTTSAYMRLFAALLLFAGIVGDFGTHSWRRGGCQALALAGWTREQIASFGRWLSKIIEIYLLDAPARYSNLALSMMRSVRGAAGAAPINPTSFHTLRQGTQLRIYLERPAPRLGAGEHAWIECSVLLAGNFSAEDVPIGAYVHSASF